MSYFLSWISGGLIRLSFFKGVFEDNIVWEDFSQLDIKVFEEGENWFTNKRGFDFNSLRL